MAPRLDPIDLTYAAGLCRRNALHTVRLAWTTHPHIGFDMAGVRWLDRYIDESRPHLPRTLVDEFVQFMGCFYGECLMATFGGAWASSGGRLAVYSDGLGYTFPFRAVGRQVRSAQDGLAIAGPVITGYSAAVAYVTAVSIAETRAA